ncbi:MAG TPA: phosphopantetheine-binding protein [Pseudonocardiaceae bacterium]|nr:phosphopantetheine-binding protein [Pseudonocardiaceae bacterium]
MSIDQILTEVRTMLTEIIGSEYALGLDIGMDTSFDTDLQLESIEFVKLSAMLTEHYGDRVDFVAFIAAKELDEIIELTVGELVTHIAERLALAGAIDD